MKKSIFKRVLAVLTAGLLALTLAPAAFAAQTSAAPVLSGSTLYANGTPVAIVENTSGGVNILWQGAEGDRELYYGGTDLTVYGGGRAGTSYAASHVTLESGTVASIYGGGVSSAVGQAVVLIKDGTVTKAVYGGGYQNSSVKYARIVLKGGNIAAVYGGGWGSTANTVASAQVIVSTGTVGQLYAGGRGTTVTAAYTELNGGSVTTATAGGLGGAVGTSTFKLDDGSLHLLQGVRGGSLNSFVASVVDSGDVDIISCGAYEQDTGSVGWCNVNKCDITLKQGSVGEVDQGYIKPAVAGAWSDTPASRIYVHLSQDYEGGVLASDLYDGISSSWSHLTNFTYDEDKTDPTYSTKYQDYTDYWADIVDDLYKLRAGETKEIYYESEYGNSIPVGVLDDIRDSGVTLIVRKYGVFDYTFSPANLPVAASGRVSYNYSELTGLRSVNVSYR